MTVKRSLFIVLMLITIWGKEILAGEVSSDLASKLGNLPSGQYHSCLVILKDRVDTHHLNLEPGRQRPSRIMRYQAILDSLGRKAKQTQGGLIDYLKKKEREGSLKEFKNFWITNVIQVLATKEQIEKIALLPEVERISDDFRIELVEPVSCKDQFSSDNSNKENWDAIGIRRVWRMGFTGKGRLVCSLDTGVEGEHPALSSRWRGNNGGSVSSSWFDPYGSPLPFDSHGHGTHTMGIMVGLTPDETLGVAFNAEWISAAVIDRGTGVSQTISDILSAFEWAVNPDGELQTTNDIPDVINNSWGIPLGILPDSLDHILWEAIDNVEEAGIVVVFSAGNEGPNSFTIRSPGDRATTPYNSFAVGAINAHMSDLPIASFSSRGPSRCDSTSIKPELSAPGVEIRSCYKNGEYKILSGTSMAAPFVSGAVAVLREYNPDATVQQIKQALLLSAIDLGTTGEDNDYGYGLMDIQRAFEYLPPPSGPCIYLDTLIVENQSTDTIVCGDTVKLAFTLKNAGGRLGQFKVELENPDMGGVLIQDEVHFDSLQQGEIASNVASPFVVYLTPSQEEKIVNFILNIKAEDRSYDRQIEFNFPAKPGADLGFEENVTPPTRFCLGQNYPNPFNPSTTIPFDLEKECFVSLKLYNMKGQLVKILLDQKLSEGRHLIIWKGEDQDGMKVASGVYFYRLKTDSRDEMKRMILVK